MKSFRFNLIVLVFATLAFPLSAQTNTFPSSGNVGIGTTNPQSNLDLGNGTGGNSLVWGGPNGANYYASIGTAYSSAALSLVYGLKLSTANDQYLYSYSAIGRAGIRIGGAPSDISFFSAAGSIQSVNGVFDYSSNTKMIIKEGGNVGIGTTNPLSKLHVMGVGQFGLNDAGTNNIGGILVASGTGVGGARQYWIGASNPTSHNNNMFEISDYDGSTNTPLMTIYGAHAGSAAGNVGIGTTDSTAMSQQKLFVAKDVTYPADVTSSQLSVGGASDPRKELAIGYDTNGNGFGFLAAGFRGVAWTNLVLQPNGGNVGIGTTNPTQKLSVNGTIQAKEVVVQAGWSDYVFDDGYKLKALSEVEAYVKTEHHLPGIPSSKEVAEHGVSMGDMQSKLLAKMEEMTLHLIAQEKRIQKLETENAALRAGRP